MQTVSFQSCTDNPSYFSEKCSQCRFACLKGSSEQAPATTSASRSSLSIPGLAAVIMGAVTSVAGYSVISAGLSVLGAAAIISRIIRK